VVVVVVVEGAVVDDCIFISELMRAAASKAACAAFSSRALAPVSSKSHFLFLQLIIYILAILAVLNRWTGRERNKWKEREIKWKEREGKRKERKGKRKERKIGQIFTGIGGRGKEKENGKVKNYRRSVAIIA
jgi:hypothetical protein